MKRVVGIGLILFVLLSGIFVFQYGRFYDGKLHVVFCNVGQGDAIFIRTPRGIDILVDGGPAASLRGEPDDKVIACLSSHMPFWDRDLELVILTHPHADHLNGLISVLGHYKVDLFATEMIKNNTGGFSRLMDEIKNQNITIQHVYAGDRFKFKDGVILNIVGPSKEFIKKTSPGGVIGERKEFASVVSFIEYKGFVGLLTGDSQSEELKESLRLVSLAQGKISILQVPHHGSKTGLSSEILDFIKPELAVISVGKNNYGHPSEEEIKILRDRNIRILRTDLNGEIEIVLDGLSWGVRN
jgi:competence protein ComEC